MDKKERLLWPDFLRSVSCIAVIMIHVTSIGAEYELNSIYLTSNLINSLSRWAVPVFFMVSGMFLLNPEHEMSREKHKRKTLHLISLTFAWNFLYSIFDNYAYNSFSWTSFPRAILNTFRGVGGYHLWFLYALILIYLSLPVLRVLTEHASSKMLWWLATLWFVFSICTGWINELGAELPFFALFKIDYSFEILTCNSGYFLLGYLLYKSRIKIKRWFAIIPLVLCLFIVTLSIICIKFFDCSPGIFAEPNGVMTCLLSALLFICASQINFKSTVIRKLITTLSGMSFGVYLVHVFWLTLLNTVLDIDFLSLGIAYIPVLFIVVFLLSLLTTAILKKIPIVKKFVAM